MPRPPFLTATTSMPISPPQWVFPLALLSARLSESHKFALSPGKTGFPNSTMASKKKHKIKLGKRGKKGLGDR